LRERKARRKDKRGERNAEPPDEFHGHEFLP
jgi:hypothetical protein